MAGHARNPLTDMSMRAPISLAAIYASGRVSFATMERECGGGAGVRRLLRRFRGLLRTARGDDGRYYDVSVVDHYALRQAVFAWLDDCFIHESQRQLDWLYRLSILPHIPRSSPYTKPPPGKDEIQWVAHHYCGSIPMLVDFAVRTHDASPPFWKVVTLLLEAPGGRVAEDSLYSHFSLVKDYNPHAQALGRCMGALVRAQWATRWQKGYVHVIPSRRILPALAYRRLPAKYKSGEYDWLSMWIAP